MKKFISIVLLTLLIPNLVFASHATELKAAMDEFQFAMTVEWDQKEESFAHKTTQAFEAKLLELVQAGLTQDDVMKVTGINSQDANEQLKLLNISNTEDLKQFMLENKVGLKGASWNGDIAPVAAAVIVVGGFVGFMAYLIISANKKFDKCVEEHGGDENACIDRGL